MKLNIRKQPWLYILPIILLFISLYGVFVLNFDILFYALISILLSTFLPILTKLFKRKTESWKYLAVQIFIFFSVYLANIHSLYKFWWYDILLHFLSGIFISLIVPYLIFSDKTRTSMSNFEWILVVIIVGIAGAGFWEMTEFLYDVLFSQDVQRNLTTEFELIGASWQNPGIRDSMNDMVNGTVGSLLSGIFVFVQSRRKNFQK